MGPKQSAAAAKRAAINAFEADKDDLSDDGDNHVEGAEVGAPVAGTPPSNIDEGLDDVAVAAVAVLRAPGDMEEDMGEQQPSDYFEQEMYNGIDPYCLILAMTFLLTGQPGQGVTHSHTHTQAVEQDRKAWHCLFW